MWYGTSYSQNYYSIANPTLPSIPLSHFNPQSNEIVSFHTDTKSSGMAPVLKKLPSSDSPLKMQVAYSSKTLLPRPNIILI
jgi:hypothetical protein